MLSASPAPLAPASYSPSATDPHTFAAADTHAATPARSGRVAIQGADGNRHVLQPNGNYRRIDSDGNQTLYRAKGRVDWINAEGEIIRTRIHTPGSFTSKRRADGSLLLVLPQNNTSKPPKLIVKPNGSLIQRYSTFSITQHANGNQSWTGLDGGNASWQHVVLRANGSSTWQRADESAIRITPDGRRIIRLAGQRFVAPAFAKPTIRLAISSLWLNFVDQAPYWPLPNLS